MTTALTYRDGDPFPGTIGSTKATSIPAWPVGPRAPAAAPNVLLVVLDDVGFAQLGCFGSDIATPTFDRLAADGLRYRNFHTTAMCSPTRACLLTGRNHHTCGMGGITDLAMGYPGYHGRIPKSCGFVSDVLRREGWATYAVGKWHLAPSDELHAGASKERWPLGQGFERYYGFIGAETNQFFPDLTIDNRQVRFDPPPGYHLTEDLVDQAITMVDDLRGADPTKPFFMYLAFGACHAPHQAPREYIDRYAGHFDGGWDRWREAIFARQLASGVMPAGSALSPRPGWVQDWDTLDPAEQRLYARMMEVFAGFLTHTDHHLGRLVDHLERRGELDNTIIIALSDNGASAEGGPNGTFNENMVFNALPHDLQVNLSKIDELGGPNTYGHYAWGWAMAGNTPFKRWKRETHEGGIGDPLIVRWPGAPDPGGVRQHYTHAVDIGATVLDACGVAMPAVLNGVAQEPLAGRSIRPSVFDGAAPEFRHTQYYEQFACRAVYHEGWKAVAFHPMGLVSYTADEDPNTPFDLDRWELYHVAADPSECEDLAAAMPDKLREMQDVWWREAGRYSALPLQSSRAFAEGRPSQVPERDRYVFRPNTAPVSEEVAPNTKLRPHRITARVTIPDGGAQGVLLAQGGRFGGYSLFVVDGRAHYALNFAGLSTTTLAAPAPLGEGRHVVTVELAPLVGLAMRAELLVDDAVVATADIERTAPFRFAIAGEGLCCGYDDGTAVSELYQSPFPFTGAIEDVVVDVSGEPVSDGDAALNHAWMTQ